MNPSDFHNGPKATSALTLYAPVGNSFLATVVDLPHCTAYLPLHATPATPGDPMGRFRYLIPSTAAFPL